MMMVISIFLKISTMIIKSLTLTINIITFESDDGEWEKRIQQPECHDASMPIVNHDIPWLLP